MQPGSQDQDNKSFTNAGAADRAPSISVTLVLMPAFGKCFSCCPCAARRPINRLRGIWVISLERQIKRHVIARRHLCHAVVAPGVEQVCARELAGLADTIEGPAPVKGGVAFRARLQDLYRANLHVRTAGRFLLRLVDFKATNFRQLEKACSAFAWDRYLPPGAVPACKVAAHRSRLYHTRAVTRHAAGAIARYWRQRDVPVAGAAGQTLFIRLEDDRVGLSLDASGPNLYRRGLKTHGGRAPLRETLAAAILQLAGYDPIRPLVDPMCGAGTFSLEAALMAKAVAPGLRRDFAFMQWPAFRPRQWDYLKRDAVQRIRTLARAPIHAADRDAQVCRRLGRCLQENGLDDAVDVQCRDFFAPGRPFDDDRLEPGLVVLNPPYGRRLDPGMDLRSFYGRLGFKLARDYTGWEVALLVPDPSLVPMLPFQLKTHGIVHGGLTLMLLTGTIR